MCFQGIQKFLRNPMFLVNEPRRLKLKTSVLSFKGHSTLDYIVHKRLGKLRLSMELSADDLHPCQYRARASGDMTVGAIQQISSSITVGAPRDFIHVTVYRSSPYTVATCSLSSGINIQTQYSMEVKT